MYFNVEQYSETYQSMHVLALHNRLHFATTSDPLLAPRNKHTPIPWKNNFTDREY